MTISKDDFVMNNFIMINKEISVRALCASTMTQVNEMLAFAARHQIRPIIEVFDMNEQQIERAMQKLERGEMRYRGVLKAL
jgi:D-arabinose 1-dehydrogenase-like Zn-dependent alcohol dehydrogenase